MELRYEIGNDIKPLTMLRGSQAVYEIVIQASQLNRAEV